MCANYLYRPISRMGVPFITWQFVVIFLHLISAAAALSNAEGNALFQVKTFLSDPRNSLRTWDPNLATPCSTWNGVTCNNNLRVTSVNIAGKGLSGSLSAAIADLQMLESLTLQENTISGPLPKELGNLSHLQTLNASNNSFNGSIPSTLGQLSNLKYLILSYNHLSGDIPAPITEISSLLNLDLAYNNLTGQIPAAALKIQSYNFVGNQIICGSAGSSPCQSNNSQSNGPMGVSSTTSTSGLIGGLVGAAALSAGLTVCVICYGRNRWHKQEIFVDVPAEDDVKIAFGQIKRFSWRELQIATNSFSEQNVVGQGAFGKVYKGILNDEGEIAVKRLLNTSLEGGEAAFLQEVEIISVAVHRNLLHLMGFCVTPSERILVYPYMSNKSVAYCLRERKPGDPGLEWNKRKNIALGAARGLTYLHDHCNPKIIHRDVKAANILLDGDFEAVVGDFGLAKMLDTRNTHATTMVRGTMGHIAPEYLSTGKATEKTDVFGYGVMLLELVTGQRAIDFSRLQDEDVLLLDHVKKLQHEKRLHSIVDPSLSEYDSQEVEQLIQVALLCTQPTADDRPSMAEVVRMLVGEGLAERWQEWQQVEIIRRQEYDAMPQRLAEWVEDSTINQDAIELSAAR